MSETPEHKYLKVRFNEILRDFSSLGLYGFTETDRKRFDFSCLLERDWTRPVAGQVLWQNTAGLDKAIRILLTDTESEIKVCIASDTMDHYRALGDTMSDFKRSGRFDDLFRLKPIWIPADFDADQEQQRLVVDEILKSQIVEDILFNVIFGRIAADDIKLVLGASGIPGLSITILHNIATEGFVNIATLAMRLGVSAGPIRERLPLLEGAGFVASPRRGALMFSETARGKVFLDLVSRLARERRLGQIGAELTYVLDKLDCKPVPVAALSQSSSDVFPKDTYVALIRTMEEATRRWDVDFENLDRSRKVELRIPDYG